MQRESHGFSLRFILQHARGGLFFFLIHNMQTVFVEKERHCQEMSQLCSTRASTSYEVIYCPSGRYSVDIKSPMFLFQNTALFRQHECNVRELPPQDAIEGECLTLTRGNRQLVWTECRSIYIISF